MGGGGGNRKMSSWRRTIRSDLTPDGRLRSKHTLPRARVTVDETRSVFVKSGGSPVPGEHPAQKARNNAEQQNAIFMTALMGTSGLIDDVFFRSSCIPHLQQCTQDDNDDHEKSDPDTDQPRGLKPLASTGIDPAQYLDFFLGQQRISPREKQKLDAAFLFFGSGLLSQYAEEMKNEYVTNSKSGIIKNAAAQYYASSNSSF